jgi:hypothetical protein
MIKTLKRVWYRMMASDSDALFHSHIADRYQTLEEDAHTRREWDNEAHYVSRKIYHRERAAWIATPLFKKKK